MRRFSCRTRSPGALPIHRATAAAVLFALAGLPDASAVDLSVSGFGTVGYARSNESFTYQRFIDDNGTFKRDSVVGLQVDGKLNSEFAATVQVKAAAATGSDRRYEGTVSWAFLSYRPSNDLLIRVGKQRLPLYLFSENYDVGASYDFLRMPTEMYSLVPSNDAISLSFNKLWRLGGGELSLDGYLGKAKNDIRLWLRDPIPGEQDSGAQFRKFDFRGGGLVLGYKTDEDTYRLGVHRAIVRVNDRTPLTGGYPFVTLAPGIGYYQVSPRLEGPGLDTVDSVTNTTFAIGADIALPSSFRFIGEYARSVVPNSKLAPKANRGYAALLKRWGKWTPYVVYSILRSPQEERDFYTQVNDNFIPNAPAINAAQRLGADQVFAYHQSSWALGTSYSFSATSKLKAEFLRTRIGDVSALVDAPPGSTIRNQNINVFSLSYSVVY